MSRWTFVVVLLLTIFAVEVAEVSAQRGRGRSRGGRWDQPLQFDLELGPAPKKPLDNDVFTFVRIRFDSYYDRYGRGKWKTDYPDSDLNFSYRLRQLTSLKVSHQPVVLELTDEKLFEYPFIYMCEPGHIVLSEAEVVALRRYLNNGGFLMADDFWGEEEYFNFYRQMKRVFPKREPVDVPLEHEIFQCVYRLKERPQVPSINVAWGGRSYERWDAKEVHYRAFFDDDERMMVFICHNTDLGDGWEREGVDEWYFRQYSEKKAYPLGINIVMYAMTH